VQKLQLLGDEVPQTPYRGFARGPHWGLSSPEPPDWSVFILNLSCGNPPEIYKKSPPKIRRDRRTRGTNSWLDDTDKKNLVPIFLYCLNCTKFSQLILREIIRIVAIRCQILKLKCTKLDFGWGSAPDPAVEAYSAPPSGFNGTHSLTHCCA